MFTVLSGCSPKWLTGQFLVKRSTPNDWQLCILCQSHDAEKGTLVVHPRHDSYQRLIDSVRECASLRDGEYVRIHQRLELCTPETLHVKEAMWHRSCYSEATNKCHIQRARDRSCHELSTGTDEYVEQILNSKDSG